MKDHKKVMNMSTVKINASVQVTRLNVCSSSKLHPVRSLTAGKIGKFRPLPEPIRLQNSVHLARLRTEIQNLKKNFYRIDIDKKDVFQTTASVISLQVRLLSSFGTLALSCMKNES